MAWQQNIVMVDGAREGFSVTMPWALVCSCCDYRTIRGSQMGEFQMRVLKAEKDAAEAHAQRVEQALREVHVDLREALISLSMSHSVSTAEAVSHALKEVEAVLSGGSGGARARPPAEEKGDSAKPE